MHIQLLGGFLVQSGNRPILFKTIPHLPALFAYLGLRLPAAVPRSQVAYHLWPDSSEKQAQTNLRKLLYHLRPELPDVILSGAGGLQLQATVDVAEFKVAMETASRSTGWPLSNTAITALARALNLYQGDLLPNCYDDWIIPERETLRHQFIHACEQMLDWYAQTDTVDDALLLANRLLRADPLREATYRRLIRLHIQNGDRAAALNCYHACANALAAELGVEPDIATRDLYASVINTGNAFPGPVLPITHPLIGREAEWEIFQSEWRRATMEGMRMLVLGGEPGIGKTRLAEDGLRWVERQGLTTAKFVCFDGDQASSFTPLIAWLRGRPLQSLEPGCRREVARLLPELLSGSELPPAPITENWQRQAFLEALTHTLLKGGANALLLDDLQWCDRDTLDWIGHLFHTRPAANLLLVATLRDGEVDAGSPLHRLLNRLRQQERLAEITLPRLTAAQTAVLAASVLMRPVVDAEAYQSAEGVPLFIIEMVRNDLDGAARYAAPEAGFSPKVLAALAGRLERLSFPARSLAEAAAVLGREFHLRLMTAISDLPENGAMLALDELWQRRIIREVGGGKYAFSHGRLHDAALLNLSPVRLRWLHLQSARALDHAGPDAALAAGHYLNAGEPERAADAYGKAARYTLDLFALEEARELSERALALTSAAPFGLYETHGDIFNLMGLKREASDAYGRALIVCPADDWRTQVRLHRKILDCISRLNFNSARNAYHQGVADLLNAPQKGAAYWAEWLELHLCWLHANYWLPDIAEMNRLLNVLERPVAQFGSPLERVQYRHCQIQAHFVSHRFTATAAQVEIAQENVAAARQMESPYELAGCLGLLGFVAFLADDFAASEHAFAASIALAESYGFLNVLEQAIAYLSLVYRRSQRPPEAARTLEVLIATVEKTQTRPYQALINAQRGWLAFLAGDLAEARERASQAVAEWEAEKLSYPLHWPGRMVLLALSIGDGDAKAAAAHAAAIFTPNQQQLTPRMAAALKAALAVGDRSALEAWQKALEIAKEEGYL